MTGSTSNAATSNPPPPSPAGANGPIPGAEIDALAAPPPRQATTLTTLTATHALTVAPREPQGNEEAKGKGKGRARPLCRFFGSRNGCRAGDACPFLHDRSRLPGGNARADAGIGPQLYGARDTSAGSHAQDGTDAQVHPSRAGRDSTPPAGRRYDPGPVERSKVVSKPVPRAQVDDPRDFQLQQLRRRFSPTERTEHDGTILIFRMVPSDPDFPFEMVGLECELNVPLTYPKSGKPSLHVTNKEMGRGYQINVEKGFDALAEELPKATLLGLMNALDKRLEAVLSEQKAETIKLLPNAGPRLQQQKVDAALEALPQPTVSIAHTPTLPTYSAVQKAQANAKREAETRQLEARLGRLPLYSKSSDGVVYTIPIEPRKRGDLPVPLQHVRTVKLFVPLLYHLEPCRIELQGVSKDAASSTENAFEQRVKANPDMSLMAHVNYLSQNMHVLAITPRPEKEEGPSGVSAIQTADTLSHTSPEDVSRMQSMDDRSHIQVIPRPPEWNVGNNEDDGTESDDYDSYDSGDESLDEDAKEREPGTEGPVEGPERGILLSFPFLELYGIELLELVSLCITVKCDRCKDRMDISNLRNNATGQASGVRSESCKKCANAMSIGYRRELMHANSVRAGYLDLDGCTVVDLLPSNFIPTCSECSTTYPAPGVVSVRGESTMAHCRQCHRKMTFKIPEVKFLIVSSAAVRANRAPPRKRPKEKLGIVAGQELPRRGRCSHYSKSYRWFRFSCCSKVFPCDKCHDADSDHPNEHANRMICGLCSREQNYRPEDCAICHSALTGKAGSGFWEGGKGTRDKVRMSRKDPRKYKRRPAARPKA